jgi:reactive intermediate/imine deaminase
VSDHISTEAAPAPSGPYVQARRSGQLLAVSGQLGKDPTSGDLAGPGVAAQVRQAIANLDAVLTAGGSSLASVLQVTCYLIDPDDRDEFNSAYAEAWPEPRPARTTVSVQLPPGLRFEIDALAAID